MNIFCFPYAGGSSFMYIELRKKLKSYHKIVPMEYPGHGLRMGEELTNSLDIIIDDMFDQIRKKDNGSPFVLLGYSLGSKLIYLLYERYKDNIMFRRLKGIFFCASTMSDDEAEKDYSSLSDDELMEYTISLGGSNLTTDEDYENFRSFLPVIRNDFILYENARNRIQQIGNVTIKQKVYVLYSSDETNIKQFDRYCDNPTEYEYFDDGHFFIHYHLDEVAEYIIDKLNY